MTDLLRRLWTGCWRTGHRWLPRVWTGSDWLSICERGCIKHEPERTDR